MITSILRIALGTLLLFLSAVFADAYSNEDILLAVNSVRNDNGQINLVENKQLSYAASIKLADIQKYQYWSHDNPQSGKKWLEFIRESNYSFATGENLAKGFDDIDSIINAWLKSPSHRKNLLSSKFNNYGLAIGQVNYAEGPQTVVVLEFGATPSIYGKLSLINFFSNPAVLM